MTRGAARWRPDVDQNAPAIDLGRLLVALRTRHHLVRAAQRKVRGGFMVEGRRLPARLIVACSAFWYYVSFGELSAVSILVAAIAGSGSSLENNLLFRCQRGGLMTLGASDCPVSAAQRKLSGGVIESSHLFPRTDGVADITVVFRLRNRLPLMRVLMTADTGQGCELVLRRRWRIAARRRLVTFAARRGCMPAS